MTVQRIIARIHQVLAWIILAGLVVQIYFSGVGLFGAESMDLHRAFGFMIELPILLLLILALAGRLGRRLIGLSALLVILTIVQVQILPALESSAPWIAALHPVNALALLGVTAASARGRQAEAPARASTTGE